MQYVNALILMAFLGVGSSTLYAEVNVQKDQVNEMTSNFQFDELVFDDIDDDALRAIIAQKPPKTAFDLWLERQFNTLMQYRMVDALFSSVWVGNTLVILHRITGALYLPELAEWSFNWLNSESSATTENPQEL